MPCKGAEQMLRSKQWKDLSSALLGRPGGDSPSTGRDGPATYSWPCPPPTTRRPQPSGGICLHLGSHGGEAGAAGPPGCICRPRARRAPSGASWRGWLTLCDASASSSGPDSAGEARACGQGVPLGWAHRGPGNGSGPEPWLLSVDGQPLLATQGPGGNASSSHGAPACLAGLSSSRRTAFLPLGASAVPREAPALSCPAGPMPGPVWPEVQPS